MSLKLPASCDPSSLGNVLQADHFVTPEQLRQAVDFQQDNADLLLGEALVRLELISKEALEIALVQQQLMRDGKASRESSNKVQKLLQAVTQHTISLGIGMELVQTMIAELARRMK